MAFAFVIGPRAPCASPAAPAALPLTIPARDPVPAEPERAEPARPVALASMTLR